MAAAMVGAAPIKKQRSSLFDHEGRELILCAEREFEKVNVAHEKVNGAPCTGCTSCPGLVLHYWRQICIACGCKFSKHQVHATDDAPLIPDKLQHRPELPARLSTDQVISPTPSSASSASTSSARSTQNRKLRFLEELVTAEDDTWTAAEYAREVEHDCEDVNTFYDRNEKLRDEERLAELEESLASVRLYGAELERNGASDWGFQVEDSSERQSNSCTFCQFVLVSAVSPDGAAANVLRPGDRILAISEDYVHNARACKKQLDYAVEHDYGEVDILFTRGEPLPSLPDFDSMDDDDLEMLVFEHTGKRIFATPGQSEAFRDEVMPLLKARFK